MVTCLDKATILPTIQRMQDLESPGLDALDPAVRVYIEALEAVLVGASAAVSTG